jgi:arylsulfatase A-like enzyme
MRSIVARGFHYIRNSGDGREELYNLAEDPEEMHDLSTTAPEAMQQYREDLTRALRGGSE